jgi:hypothetical protein
MKKPFVVLAGIVAAALALGPSPASAEYATRILGGGARFDEVSRLSFYFGMDATILEKGEAYGQFTSVTVDQEIIIGNFTRGTINDDGSVALAGIASAFDLDGRTSAGFPYSIVVWPDEPRAGRFLLKTPDNGDGDYWTMYFGSLEVARP